MRNPKILVLDRGEELAQQIQHVADELRPRPDIVPCTRLGSVGELWRQPERYYLLVEGPSLARIQGLVPRPSIHVTAESGGKYLLTNH